MWTPDGKPLTKFEDLMNYIYTRQLQNDNIKFPDISHNDTINVNDSINSENKKNEILIILSTKRFKRLKVNKSSTDINLKSKNNHNDSSSSYSIKSGCNHGNDSDAVINIDN